MSDLTDLRVRIGRPGGGLKYSQLLEYIHTSHYSTGMLTGGPRLPLSSCTSPAPSDLDRSPLPYISLSGGLERSFMGVIESTPRIYIRYLLLAMHRCNCLMPSFAREANFGIFHVQPPEFAFFPTHNISRNLGRLALGRKVILETL